MDVRAFVRHRLEYVLDPGSVSRLRRQVALDSVPGVRTVFTARGVVPLSKATRARAHASQGERDGVGLIYSHPQRAAAAQLAP